MANIQEIVFMKLKTTYVKYVLLKGNKNSLKQFVSIIFVNTVLKNY